MKNVGEGSEWVRDKFYDGIERVDKKIDETINSIKEGAKFSYDAIKYQNVPTYSEDKPTSNKGDLSKNDKYDDKTFSQPKQKMIKCLSGLWYDHDNGEVRKNAHKQANALRGFDDKNITRAFLLNDSDGAHGAGHNAVMLVNKDDKGVLFSVYPTTMEFPDVLHNKAELRFTVLSSDDVRDFIKNNGRTTEMGNTVATDGEIITDENYNRLVGFVVSEKEGSKMFEYAVNRYDNPRAYNLKARNCNDFAYDCLFAGGVKREKHLIPNISYAKTLIDDLKNVIKN